MIIQLILLRLLTIILTLSLNDAVFGFICQIVSLVIRTLLNFINNAFTKTFKQTLR